MIIHDINYWQNLKTTDEILSSYELGKKAILASNPADYGRILPNYISVDSHCMIRSGNLDYQCGNCLLLHRLGINSSGIITLENGSLAGKRLILKEVQNTSLFLKYDPSSTSLLTNEFTQRLLGSWLLAELEIPILQVYTGFICGKNGYLLYELPEAIANPTPELLNQLDKIDFRCDLTYDLTDDLFFFLNGEVKFRVPGSGKFKLPTGTTIRTTTCRGGRKISQIKS